MKKNEDELKRITVKLVDVLNPYMSHEERYAAVDGLLGLIATVIHVIGNDMRESAISGLDVLENDTEGEHDGIKADQVDTILGTSVFISEAAANFMDRLK